LAVFVFLNIIFRSEQKNCQNNNIIFFIFGGFCWLPKIIFLPGFLPPKNIFLLFLVDFMIVENNDR
jgi:hypothetical protein